MAIGHEFNFEGGGKLTSMGATWFVSYAYYEKIDAEHKNWENVDTKQHRKRVYRNSREYHEFWLKQIINMNDSQLVKNQIGLKPIEIKRMAKAVLERINSK